MEQKFTKNFIEVQDITYSYKNGEEAPDRALDHVSLTVREGEFLAILGHNGSGKSTLARMFNGILLPDSGRVLVDGMDTANEDTLFDVRQRVGLVFQNPDNQIVSTIVEEDVAFAPENLGVPPEEIRTRVDEALKAVGMYDYRSHAPHLLSGGQKQRVAIAGVIAMMPNCIVLDEPTAMLDPAGREEVEKTILRLNRERGMTVVIITHYMDEAVPADRIITMNDGKVHMEGTPAEIFSEVEELRRIGLEVPQATELCWRLQQEGLEVPTALTVEQGIESVARLMENSRA